MTRLFAVAIAAAAVLAPASAAHATHICVTSGGDPVVCTPHPEQWIASPDEICVRYGSTNIVCVF